MKLAPGIVGAQAQCAVYIISWEGFYYTPLLRFMHGVLHNSNRNEAIGAATASKVVADVRR